MTSRPRIHSDADELITIHKVSYAPFADNLGGIYSRPLESHFADVLGQMHRWSTGPVVNVNGASLRDMEANPDAVKLAAAGNDAFFSCKNHQGTKRNFDEARFLFGS